MLINDIPVNERHSNPPVLSKTALRMFFIQDGSYFDPYEISSVSIFKSSTNFDPSSILNNEELISSSVSSFILMNFSNSSADPNDQSFNPIGYEGVGEPNIYKLRTGEYAVILDQTVNQEGRLNLFNTLQTIDNAVSNVGDFIDVWTVKMVEGSEFETIINYFTLTRGNFFSITEPIMFRTRNKLLNNSIILGSKVDVKISTELTIENPNLSEEIRNVIKNSVIKNPALEIYKINEESSNLPARVTVSSFSQTSSLATTTAGDTIVFTWDTDALKTHPEALLGNFAGIKGIYAIQAKYSILNERILTPLMHLTVE